MKNNEELFSRADSLGSMNSSQIGSYLTEIGDLDAAAPFMPGVSPQSLFGPKEPWRHTGLILGFIAQLAPGDAKTSAIIGAGDLQGDKGLVGKRIKITLDKFYVRKYPGKGDHSILCEFAGKNQVEGETEELRLALRFDAADKTSVAISGAPIFIGVTVGPNGISFEGRSINVRSSTDDAIVAALDDQAFKSGLSLLMTAQPALKPLASLATAAVKAVCSKSGNRQVHNYKLGLDFGAGATSARLRHGSYVVVQSDDAHVWTWDAFEWNRDSMNLQYKADPTRELDFNFMVFGVTEYLES